MKYSMNFLPCYKFSGYLYKIDIRKASDYKLKFILTLAKLLKNLNIYITSLYLPFSKSLNEYILQNYTYSSLLIFMSSDLLSIIYSCVYTASKDWKVNLSMY